MLNNLEIKLSNDSTIKKEIKRCLQTEPVFGVCRRLGKEMLFRNVRKKELFPLIEMSFFLSKNLLLLSKRVASNVKFVSKFIT